MSPFLTLRSKHFTDVLRVQALLHGGSYNITPSQVSVGAFRTTGAMALFHAGVDSTRIRLLGRWDSWAMLRYLHVQSNTQMASFAHRMLSGGSFTSLACNTPPEPENPENPEAPPVIAPGVPIRTRNLSVLLPAHPFVQMGTTWAFCFDSCLSLGAVGPSSGPEPAHLYVLN